MKRFDNSLNSSKNNNSNSSNNDGNKNSEHINSNNSLDVAPVGHVCFGERKESVDDRHGKVHSPKLRKESSRFEVLVSKQPRTQNVKP